MLNILDILSPKLKDEYSDYLTPLEQGQTAEFRLTRAGQVDPNSSKQTATPQFHGLPGYDMIRDQHDKDHPMKEIMNIKSFKAIKEKGKPTWYEPEVEGIAFGSSGSIYILPDDGISKLFFMRLMNKNKTNPNRIPASRVVFFEVDDKKELSLKNNILDYRGLCTIILLESEDEELFEIASKLSLAFPGTWAYLSSIKDVGVVKATLGGIIEANAIDFIRGTKDIRAYARLVVDFAVGRKKIIFNDHSEKLTWEYKALPGTKGKKIITKVEKPKSAVKDLVKFLKTAEGNEHYLELKEFYEKNY